MRVTFPFLYSATSIENGEIAPCHKGGWAEFDIPDASEAPRVCDIEGFSPEGIPYLIEVRKMDGQFYRPKLSIQSASYFPIDDGSDRVNLRTIGSLVPSYFLRNGEGQTPLPDRRDQIVRYIESEENTRATVTDERETTLETIAAALENLVVVNGEVWERCPEPRLFADLFHAPPKVGIVFEPEGERSPKGVASIMPVDQTHSFMCMLEEACAAEALRRAQQEQEGRNEHRRQWTMRDLPTFSLEVFDETLLSDPTRQGLEAAKRSLNDILGHADLKGFKRPVVIEWLNFRDALEKAEADPSKENMESMFMHWANTTEFLERSLAEEVPAGYNNGSEGVACRIRSKREAEAYREGFWRVHDGLVMDFSQRNQLG
ncbi:hypothetical protein [Rhizobium sp. BK176]|uniref:hypothetical protein n=1 Tax=Rhizobium sp. BK176 TaxID=2587071 RepID=UPI0021681D4E|nr:hypothetical protein [Rhizobium sp. BK176]MCS4089720.1 hypothetical protein [Rhizobium sp. BK176]